jgi:hypothetical protein
METMSKRTLGFALTTLVEGVSYRDLEVARLRFDRRSYDVGRATIVSSLSNRQHIQKARSFARMQAEIPKHPNGNSGERWKLKKRLLEVAITSGK